MEEVKGVQRDLVVQLWSSPPPPSGVPNERGLESTWKAESGISLPLSGNLELPSDRI
jgi:hypothetical protein